MDSTQATSNGKTRIVVTTLGADRSGIVAAVATKLAENDANILEISQAILDGIFTMSMIVELDEGKTSFKKLSEELTSLNDKLGVQVQAQREDVFKFMYRI
ncbi:MAG: ACT domain-containing protein [Coriobacteriales bacterium]|jgi:ACT domain-containing protein